MALYKRTEGVCLRRVDYGDTSQVATFVTPEGGSMSFMCRGEKRAPKKGVKRGLELGARYRLVYYSRRSSSLYMLADHPMLESFRTTRSALERIVCSYYCVELMRTFASEGAPCAALYELLVKTLRRISRGEQLGLSVLFLELAVLQDHGTLPEFGCCVDCGKELRERGRLVFSAFQGGPRCRRCAGSSSDPPSSSVPVRASRLAMLGRLCGHPTDGLRDLDVGPKEIVAMSRLLRFHIRYMLGREMRMWKYLHGRHLSRSLRRIKSG